MKKRSFKCFLLLLFALLPFGIQAKQISYTITRKDFTCHISYTLTNRRYVKIKRVTNGIVDYLIVAPLEESYAKEIYDRVSANPEFFRPFMPSFIKRFGSSVRAAKRGLRRTKALGKLGIYHQREGEERRRLVGILGGQGRYNYDAEKRSMDAMYSTLGTPKDLDVKGIAYTAVRALFDMFIFQNTAGILVLIMHKENQKSIHIAEKLLMTKDKNAKKHTYWGYPHPREEVFVFHITAEDWKKKHWQA